MKIEPGATLQEARIGSEYHNGYTVTNAGTISGGTFYGKVICEAGAVISGGTFKELPELMLQAARSPLKMAPLKRLVIPAA